MKLYSFKLVPLVKWTEDGEFEGFHEGEFPYTLKRVIASSRELATEVVNLEAKAEMIYISHAKDYKYTVEFLSEEEIVDGFVL